MDSFQSMPIMKWAWPLSLVMIVGCAELSGLNPYYRSQWAEDERLMPSFHTHLGRIRALEGQAPSMAPAEQQRVAAELTRLIRDDKNSVLRIAAVKSLSAFPSEVSRTGILLAASDSDANLRVEACPALRKIGDIESIGLLTSLVENDTSLDVRIAATRELGGVQDALAFQALSLALEDPNPALQFRAMQSLATSSGRQYGNDIALWRGWLRGENPNEPEVNLAERVRSILR